MAVVVKYADNILKGFAASFAMVVTFIVSMYFSNFYPNQNFYIGAVRIPLCIHILQYLEDNRSLTRDFYLCTSDFAGAY